MMDMPNENTFKRKGEFAPANIQQDSMINEPPVPLKYSQFDETGVGIPRIDLRPHVEEKRQRRKKCCTKRTCCIVTWISIVLLILLLTAAGLVYYFFFFVASEQSSSQIASLDKIETSALFSGRLKIFTINYTWPQDANWYYNHSHSLYRGDLGVLESSPKNNEKFIELLCGDLLKVALPWTVLCQSNECHNISYAAFSYANSSAVGQFNITLLPKKFTFVDANDLVLYNFFAAVNHMFESLAHQDLRVNMRWLKSEIALNLDSLCASSIVKCTPNSTFVNEIHNNINMENDSNLTTFVNIFQPIDWRNRSSDDFDWENSTSLHLVDENPISLGALKFKNQSSLSKNGTLQSANKTEYSLSRFKRCPVEYFPCADKSGKVPNYQRCDGVQHCKDNSDELNCGGCKTSFNCTALKGGRLCLRGKYLCDQTAHCKGAYDERLYCRRDQCKWNEYRCDNSQMCIPKTFLCDGDKHCPLGDDEKNCNWMEKCHNGALWCASENRCLAWYAWCSDEDNCMLG